MKSKLKQIPEFKNEDEERLFWAKADSADYINWNKSSRGVVFSKLKISPKDFLSNLNKYVLKNAPKNLAKNHDKYTWDG